MNRQIFTLKSVVFLFCWAFLIAEVHAQDSAKVIQTGRAVLADVQSILKHKPRKDSCLVANDLYKSVVYYNKKIRRIQNEPFKRTITQLKNINTAFKIQFLSEKDTDDCSKINSYPLIKDVDAWSAALKAYRLHAQVSAQLNRPGVRIHALDSTHQPSQNDTVLIKVKPSKESDGQILIAALSDTGKYQVSKTKKGYAGNLIMYLVPRKPKSPSGSSRSKEEPVSSKEPAGGKDNLGIPKHGPATQHFTQMNNRLWIGLVTLTVLCLSLAVFLGLYMRKLRKLKQAQLTTTPDTGAAVTVDSVATTLKNPKTLVIDKYFECELMLTAGPRKAANEDIDLGEDVCGFINKSNEVLFWVIDGSSDYQHVKSSETNKDLFSSRLLAQSIALYLRLYAENKSSLPEQIVLEILESIKSDWLAELNALSPGEKKALAGLFKEQKFFQCATTVLFAALDINGDLKAYRCGDSKMYVYHKKWRSLKLLSSALAEKNQASEEKIFFRLTLENDDFVLQYNTPPPLFERMNKKNVSFIVAGSDGVGRVTTQMLQQHKSVTAEALRTQLTRQVQGTLDDKTLCIIEIK